MTKKQEDPLGWVAATSAGPELRPGRVHWLSLVGVLAIVIAFGHSILAMSGEETLAQIYREVEAPKLKNFKRAAFIVFVYSIVLTGHDQLLRRHDHPRPRPAGLPGQPDLRAGDERRGAALGQAGSQYAGGRRRVLDPWPARSTPRSSGSNGVLNRVTEDGVLPEWLQKPHKTYGSTWRLLSLVAGLQVAAILLSGGDVILLGEAYAFGVVWSLVFKALSMLVLRFTEPERHREYRVPLNVRIGRLELPVGLCAGLPGPAGCGRGRPCEDRGDDLRSRVRGGVPDRVRHDGALSQEAGGETAEGGCAIMRNWISSMSIDAERLTEQALELHHADRKVVSLGISGDLKALETCLIETDPCHDGHYRVRRLHTPR